MPPVRCCASGAERVRKQGRGISRRHHMFDKCVKQEEVLRAQALRIPFRHVTREGLPMRMHEFVGMAIEYQPRRPLGDLADYPLHYRQAEHPKRAHVGWKEE